MIALVNPCNVVLERDVFTTGVVYMPFGLAYLAASLQKNGHPVRVVDAFGEAPLAARRKGDFLYFGLEAEEVAQRIPAEASLVFVYAINLTNHDSTVENVAAIKRRHPRTPVVIVENTQAVTAYSLREVADQFYDAGADYVITGESEQRALQLVNALATGNRERLREIDGLGNAHSYTEPKQFNRQLDDLPFPAWELFPLENYWGLRFGHGPFSSKRYLPLLTSRGCPYPCKFCVVPATNENTWRFRSAQNVVDEMAYMQQRFGVSEFHLEDLNPTVNDKRTRAICEEILRRKLRVTWKLVSGTKVETMKNEETVALMAQAGCRYISVSPETGSPRVLKLINKPFDLGHAVKLVAKMNEVGIFSQACFVLGFPGEEPEDLEMTRRLALELTRKGVDEIALFIVSPVPGSSIYETMAGYGTLSQLNFSPAWRPDYAYLSAFRKRLYRQFLLTKLAYHPGKVLMQCVRFLRRRFETKMEMVPYRALRYRLAGRRARNVDPGPARGAPAGRLAPAAQVAAAPFRKAQ